VAIDVSIWQFQTQAGQGGSNPAIRTFYYRLLRLLSLSVQPIFIFDGPHKPPFKRNKKSGHHGASVPNMLTKQMLKLFGFPFYQAPGEAEAECALLQREAIVDAVLSEDVDTLMFGCGQTLRNWSSEGSRGNKSPTHVSVYNAKATKEGSSGLDREGMVLVALMSGGDYITEGIPGCGIKVACQAARAGYGKSLCQLSRTDVSGLEAWRKDLNHEMQTNESKYFRTRHKTLKIPDSFPDKEVLGYYTHPVVSSAAKIQKLRDEIVWDGQVDVPSLRLFVAEAFEWTNRIGAVKFIRGLAPALLTHKLLSRRDRRDSGYGDLILTAMNEMELVRSIAGNRNHFSTDGIRELRLVYLPTDIVGLDLDAEYDDSKDYGRDGLAPVGDDDQIEAYASDEGAGKAGRGPSQYDPTQLDKVWVPSTIARLGIPLKVEDYEESLKDPRKFVKAKAAAKRAATKNTSMPKGAMDRFVTTSKPGIGGTRGIMSKPPAPAYSISDDDGSLPPVFLAPMLEELPASQLEPKPGRSTRNSVRTGTEAPLPKTKPQASKAHQRPGTNTNPWSLASSQSCSNATIPITKPSFTRQTQRKPSSPKIIELLSSSPLAPSPPSITDKRASTPKRKSHHSPSPSPPVSPSPLPKLQHSHAPSQEESAFDLHEELELPTSVTVSRHRGGRHRENPNPPSPSRIETPSCAYSKDRPSPRKKTSPHQVRGDEDTHTLGLPGEEKVARKIDFGPISTPLTKATSEFPPSSLLSSPFDDLALSGDPDLLPRPRTSPPPERGSAAGTVIDLSSSPLASPPPLVPAVLARTHPHPLPPSHDQLSLKKSGSSQPNLSTPQDAPDAKPEPRQTRKGKKGKGKYIVLRESDVGAWKEVDEAELEEQSIGPGEADAAPDRDAPRGRGRREGMWRYSEVEVLDLTGDDEQTSVEKTPPALGGDAGN
jgi:Holliday junction resolvase YEN1